MSQRDDVLIIPQQELNKAQEDLEQERQLISAVNEEMKELEGLQKKKSSEMTEHNLEIQKLEHEVDRQNREHQNSRDVVARLEEEHEWITDQKQYVLQVALMHDVNTIHIDSLVNPARHLTLLP